MLLLADWWILPPCWDFYTKTQNWNEFQQRQLWTYLTDLYHFQTCLSSSVSKNWAEKDNYKLVCLYNEHEDIVSILTSWIALSSLKVTEIPDHGCSISKLFWRLNMYKIHFSWTTELPERTCHTFLLSSLIFHKLRSPQEHQQIQSHPEIKDVNIYGNRIGLRYTVTWLEIYTTCLPIW